MVADDSTWEAGDVINARKCLMQRENIMKDFPQPSCKVLIASKLNEEMKGDEGTNKEDQQGFPHWG